MIVRVTGVRKIIEKRQLITHVSIKMIAHVYENSYRSTVFHCLSQWLDLFCTVLIFLHIKRILYISAYYAYYISV